MRTLFGWLAALFLFGAFAAAPIGFLFIPQASIAECYALIIGSLFVSAGSFLLSQD